jgi:hypothetical protein
MCKAALDGLDPTEAARGHPAARERTRTPMASAGRTGTRVQSSFLRHTCGRVSAATRARRSFAGVHLRCLFTDPHI